MKSFSFGGKKPTVKKAAPAVAFGEDEDVKQEIPKCAAMTAADDGDVDPLDAFMATNQQRGAQEAAKKAEAQKKMVDRFEDEEDDPQTRESLWNMQSFAVCVLAAMDVFLSFF